jgi:hypothetical protein
MEVVVTIAGKEPARRWSGVATVLAAAKQESYPHIAASHERETHAPV